MNSALGAAATADEIIRALGQRRYLTRAVAHSRRIAASLCAALAAICLLGITAGQALAGEFPARVPATQELVVLLAAHTARRAPTAGSPQMALVAARRPITGEPTTLPVLSRSIDPHGMRWLRVMLPGRPNGSAGWIPQQGTRPLVTRWRIDVDLNARSLTTYRDGRAMRVFQAVIGKPSTPTPTGQFFVEESVRMPVGQAGGPFALALSARSNVLQEFQGGPGQIAIHGSEDLIARLGTATSFGCIRLDNASIDWLAKRIPPGTPVSIYRT